jgi:hypothetical protein
LKNLICSNFDEPKADQYFQPSLNQKGMNHFNINCRTFQNQNIKAILDFIENNKEEDPNI